MIRKHLWQQIGELSFIALAAAVLVMGGVGVADPGLIAVIAVFPVLFLVVQIFSRYVQKSRRLPLRVVLSRINSPSSESDSVSTPLLL